MKKSHVTRERRLYFPRLKSDVVSDELTAQDPAFHYLAHVLRVKQGQVLTLFNGEGLVAAAHVICVEKKRLVIDIGPCTKVLASSLKTHLYLGVSKGDRMDYALQKSTELGVTHITPVWTERSDTVLKGERLEKKIAHWNGVITAACEQCVQNFRPLLAAPTTLADVELDTAPTALLFLLDPKGQSMSHYGQDLQEKGAAPTNIQFLVGAEGGWSEDEVQILTKRGARPLRLGPRILRTETAPVVMLSLAQSLWGDF